MIVEFDIDIQFSMDYTRILSNGRFSETSVEN